MQCPVDAIEVLQKMTTLDEIYQPGDYRKWHHLRAWLNEKAAQQSVRADAGDSAASSELVQASAESTSQTVTQATQRR